MHQPCGVRTWTEPVAAIRPRAVLTERARAEAGAGWLRFGTGAEHTGDRDPSFVRDPRGDTTVMASRCRRLRRAKHGCRAGERPANEGWPLWGSAAKCLFPRGFLRRG
jgi:hypothetical protein